MLPIESRPSRIKYRPLWFMPSLSFAAFLRRRMIKPSEESLRSNPDDESALKKWRTGVIVSLVMASTIVLFGLVLKFMGATWNVASWFFIVGILLLLAWTPRLDLSAV